MTNQKFPILAREGWWHCALSLTAAVAVHFFLGFGWAAPFWLFAALTFNFFRDPPRERRLDDRRVLCPADGKVIVLADAEDPYLKRPAKKISIFMNPFNVHTNLSPVAGKVMQRWYEPGSFFNADLDKASHHNERNALWIKTDQGTDVVVVQVAGFLARRILCYAKVGDRLSQGERFGFIRFGSRVDLYLPPTARFETSLGEKVKGAVVHVALL